MASDGFGLFTDCHRLYVQGVRRALRERLESAHGDNWWERGVLPALTDDQRRDFDFLLSREPTTDLGTHLDTRHFARIVMRSHAAAFVDAFPGIDSVLSRFRFLASIRNEWAHIPEAGLPLPKVKSASKQ